MDGLDRNSVRDINSIDLDEFYSVTSDLALQLSIAGSCIKSDPSTICDKFVKSTDKLREQFLNKCKFYTDLIRSALDSEIDIVEDKRLIYMTLSKLNCIPNSNLMDLIEDGDAVELYDVQGKMVFSNFDFCAVTSYTIEELFWIPWNELFSRKEDPMLQIMSEFAKAISAKGPFKPNVDIHKAWETLHGHNNTAIVEMKMFSPLKSRDNINYVIAASKITT